MEQLIHTFYQAFSKLDAETMVSCYHQNIKFHDPAFGELNGERAKNMWRMLCDSQKNKDFRVIYSKVIANELNGTAHWEAFYTFSKTRRKVHNIINASFEFEDGKIINHQDEFILKNWAKQAIGFKGWLLGNTSFFQKKLQTQTNLMLDKYNKKFLETNYPQGKPQG